MAATTARPRTPSSTRQRSSSRSGDPRKRAARTDRRPLRQIARHVCVPTGIVTTEWPAIRWQSERFGRGFDDWQESIGALAFAKRSDGCYAAGIGGVVLSIPRQVGKTYFVSTVTFALCALRPGTTVLWTAHRLRTANETLAKLRAMANRRLVKPHIAAVRVANGEGEVRFRNGSRILFGARERGFGRGFDDVDVIVFDEAQILTANAIEDMIPATNVAANPLIFYVGTPPAPKDPSEVFRTKRKDAVAGDEDTLFVEFSADANADPDDETQWAKANPNYPKRTNRAAFLRMRKNLNTPGSFEREGLGIWDDIDANAGPLSLADWSACPPPITPGRPPVTLSLEVSLDRTAAWLLAVEGGPDGLPQVSLVPTTHDGEAFAFDGTAPIPKRVAQVVAKNRDVVSLAVDKFGNAATLVDDIRAEVEAIEGWAASGRRFEIVELGGPEFVDASGQIEDAIRFHRIAHADSLLMETAVKQADVAERDGARFFRRAKSGPQAGPFFALLIGVYAWRSAGKSAPIEPFAFWG